MDDLNRKRLEWMAKATTGMMFPKDLFNGPNGWGPAITEAAKAALDEIDRLNKKNLT